MKNYFALHDQFKSRKYEKIVTHIQKGKKMQSQNGILNTSWYD